MIKNRSFMFGLGTGLIAGALLLQVMITGGAAPLSKEKLIKEAAKLNLTVTDPSATPTATSNTGNTGEGTEGSGKEGTAAVVPSATESAAPASPASTPQAAVEPSAAAAPSKPATPSKPASEKKPSSAPVAPATPEVAVNGSISVTIPTGSTLTETADLLVKAGVITDKNKFLQTAVSRKANTKIQNGRYSFTKGESNNVIIDKLITVK
ncbi:hypothetical protein NST99_19975 [Paenibacillus sp. FSL L8-0470]|uniref:hypothetical protein n=1 Tax=unclassified Paenibacillus TaxID=185978 RepID=UPI0030F946DE